MQYQWRAEPLYGMGESETYRWTMLMSSSPRGFAEEKSCLCLEGSLQAQQNAQIESNEMKKLAAACRI